MSTDGLIVGDLAVSVLAAAGWLAAGASTAARRPKMALLALGFAVVASLGRIVVVWVLAGAGWWFVEEKVTLTLPLLLVAGLAAVLLAGPRLVAAVRPKAVPVPASDEGVGRAAVVLLTAGYAAAAGPVVTLLSGYPVGWSVALITVAVVGAAAVLTARVLAVPRLRAAAVASFTAAVVGAGLALVAPSTVDNGGASGSDAATAGSAAAVPVSSLRGPDTPEAGGAVRRYTLTARTATIRLASGRQVAAWTFNGQVPGPPIAATQGDLLEVTLRNADIDAGVTLHWHGYDVPAAADGVPGLTQDAVLPGQEYVYRFRAEQAGTYWYHTHEVSDRGVKLGLYGSFVVSPRAAKPGVASSGVDFTLPVHLLGGSTVVGDRDAMTESTVRAGTPVRLRVINTDDVPRVFALAGTPYRLTAVDGADVNAPAEVKQMLLRLPAGGRYDLTFTMPAGPATLALTDDPTTGLTLRPDGNHAAAPTAGAWPVLDLLSYGAPAPTPFDANAAFDRRFTLVLDQGLAITGGKPAYAQTVNGRAFPSVPSLEVREGDLVMMTVVNRSRATHPWHLHGHRVLVLSRDGIRPTGSPLWLDTFDVRPGEVWQVGFRADNPGLWMNHCHNLSHADQGMALHLEYQGVTSTFHGGHAG